MPDELTQLCAREFARHIDDLFGKYRIETSSDGPDWVETPVVGLFHRIGDEAAAAALKELDRRALAAQEWFRTHGPAWAQPLPVSWPKLCMWARVGKFLEAGILAPDNGRWELLASFAISWFETKFDPTHPSFNRFARGVMADKSTPARLRDNPELRKEYPPKRLSTLVSAQMAAALDHSEAILAAKAANK
jgi:hypothetical protein